MFFNIFLLQSLSVDSRVGELITRVSKEATQTQRDRSERKGQGNLSQVLVSALSLAASGLARRAHSLASNRLPREALLAV